MLRKVMCASVLLMAGSWAAAPARSASIHIDNASFEAPALDPNDFPAKPDVDGWTEIDLDTVASRNTGVFLNTAEGNTDHIVNADGNQLAFLGSEAGNALEQDLVATYRVGCDYRLTVAVAISENPLSQLQPDDAIEIVLFYLDSNEPVDIAVEVVAADGLSSTLLQDFSVYLPTVQSGDAWAGKTIGVAIRAAGMPGGFWDLDNVRLTESLPVSIPIENASFEAPEVDPNDFPAWPYIDGWTEIDVDPEGLSRNTGVFPNTPEGSPDHIVNADGSQLAFLGSEAGNALEQDLDATYKVGSDYRLTVAVGISSKYAPSTEIPVDILELVLFYRDGADMVDIVSQTVDATGLSPVRSTDVSLYLPTVQPGDAWAGMTISVALRSIGMPGGFWALDNVRLARSLPDPDLALTVIKNE